MLDLTITISFFAAAISAIAGKWFFAVLFSTICFVMVNIKNKQKKEEKPLITPSPQPLSVDDGYQEFITLLKKARETYPQAYHAIMSLATTDGAISKQEMRVAFGMFSKLGIDIGARAEMLLTKHTPVFRYRISEPSLNKQIAEIAKLHKEAQRAILAASEAIIACTMKTNKGKAALHSRIQAACGEYDKSPG